MYTVDELVTLAERLRKLGVTKLKAGDVELEMMPEAFIPGEKQLAPEEMEQAIADARKELDEELHAAS